MFNSGIPGEKTTLPMILQKNCNINIAIIVESVSLHSRTT